MQQPERRRRRGQWGGLERRGCFLIDPFEQCPAPLERIGFLSVGKRVQRVPVLQQQPSQNDEACGRAPIAVGAGREFQQPNGELQVLRPGEGIGDEIDDVPRQRLLARLRARFAPRRFDLLEQRKRPCLDARRRGAGTGASRSSTASDIDAGSCAHRTAAGGSIRTSSSSNTKPLIFHEKHASPAPHTSASSRACHSVMLRGGPGSSRDARCRIQRRDETSPTDSRTFDPRMGPGEVAERACGVIWILLICASGSHK